MKITVSDHFYPLFDVKKRYLIIYGGRGSGKSEFCGRKIFKRCMEEGNHEFLIIRKVARDNDGSTTEVLLRILSENDIAYTHNQTKKLITFYSPTGKPNKVFFDGLDNRERIKSKKGVTSIWIEEATELSKADFMQVDLILREPTDSYHQIMMSFNPDEAQAAWIKKRFFQDEFPRIGLGKAPHSYLHWSTLEHNPIASIRRDYAERLATLDDPVYIKVYKEGLWALAKGLIFPNWNAELLPTKDLAWYDEIFYGGDFGYSVDPAAVVRIYRKADEFWVEEVIYEPKLTNPELGRKMKSCGIQPSDITYWDSAEPKSIQELCNMGLVAKPALKGADSVRASIDYLKTLKIHIVETSSNIIKERQKYKYKEDKDGNSLAVPVDFDNHAMDAIRYGIYTHMKKAKPEIHVISTGQDKMTWEQEWIERRQKREVDPDDVITKVKALNRVEYAQAYVQGMKEHGDIDRIARELGVDRQLFRQWVMYERDWINRAARGVVNKRGIEVVG